jgi:hypothetical protein
VALGRGDRRWDLATYIPELATADPATFGVGLATRDGQVYTAGDLVPFTIQSVSKPFVYALALADQGYDAVLAKGSQAAASARSCPRVSYPWRSRISCTVSMPTSWPRSRHARGPRSSTQGRCCSRRARPPTASTSSEPDRSAPTSARDRGLDAACRRSRRARRSAELAIIDGLPRSTRISALEPTICFILTPDAYAELHEQAPAACAELTRAVARSLSQRLRYSTADVATFEET